MCSLSLVLSGPNPPDVDEPIDEFVIDEDVRFI